MKRLLCFLGCLILSGCLFSHQLSLSPDAPPSLCPGNALHQYISAQTVSQNSQFTQAAQRWNQALFYPQNGCQAQRSARLPSSLTSPPSTWTSQLQSQHKGNQYSYTQDTLWNDSHSGKVIYYEQQGQDLSIQKQICFVKYGDSTWSSNCDQASPWILNFQKITDSTRIQLSWDSLRKIRTFNSSSGPYPAGCSYYHNSTPFFYTYQDYCLHFQSYTWENEVLVDSLEYSYDPKYRTGMAQGITHDSIYHFWYSSNSQYRDSLWYGGQLRRTRQGPDPYNAKTFSTQAPYLLIDAEYNSSQEQHHLQWNDAGQLLLQTHSLDTRDSCLWEYQSPDQSNSSYSDSNQAHYYIGSDTKIQRTVLQRGDSLILLDSMTQGNQSYWAQSKWVQNLPQSLQGVFPLLGATELHWIYELNQQNPQILVRDKGGNLRFYFQKWPDQIQTTICQDPP